MLINLLVLLAVVSQDEILELHLYLHPLLVTERGPDVVSLCDGGLIWLQENLGLVIVHMEGSQDQDETGEGLGVDNNIFILQNKYQMQSKKIVSRIPYSLGWDWSFVGP